MLHVREHRMSVRRIVGRWNADKSRNSPVTQYRNGGWIRLSRRQVPPARRESVTTIATPHRARRSSGMRA